MAILGKNMLQKVTAKTGRQFSLKVTLTANTNLTVNIPDGAQGFALRPAAEIRFAVMEAVDAGATVSSVPVLKSEFKLGGIAEANVWEVRTIDEGDNRYITLRSTANTTCDVEVF